MWISTPRFTQNDQLQYGILYFPQLTKYVMRTKPYSHDKYFIFPFNRSLYIVLYTHVIAKSANICVHLHQPKEGLLKPCCQSWPPYHYQFAPASYADSGKLECFCVDFANRVRSQGIILGSNLHMGTRYNITTQGIPHYSAPSSKLNVYVLVGSSHY